MGRSNEKILHKKDRTNFRKMRRFFRFVQLRNGSCWGLSENKEKPMATI